MKIFLRIIKGVVIGIATLVPGVSGGTMAIILGLYDDIIHSISTFFRDIKRNTIFLVTVGTGGIMGLVAFSPVMEFALTHFKHPMVYLFIGIIVGGIPVLYKKVKSEKLRVTDWLFFSAGMIIILLMSFYNVTIVNLANSTGILQFVFLFFAGIVIAVALILPGLSTSFMLFAIGLYEVTIKAISNIDINFLVPIGLGTVFGVIATTKVLENCLNNKPKQTYMLILGFVLGSIVDILVETGIPSGLNIVISLAAFILGFIVIRWMSERFAE